MKMFLLFECPVSVVMKFVSFVGVVVSIVQAKRLHKYSIAQSIQATAIAAAAAVHRASQATQTAQLNP